jgi:hypothetical protein
VCVCVCVCVCVTVRVYVRRPTQTFSRRHIEPAIMATRMFSCMQKLIDGAQCTVLSPAGSWNQCLILFCHGHRPEGTPLTADPDELLADAHFHRLLQAGWVVGMTSYRRNGRIIRDAMKDVMNLRNYVCTEIGVPDHTILEGRSMGGCICTHLSEQANAARLFDGVLAIGAALLAKDDDFPIVSGSAAESCQWALTATSATTTTTTATTTTATNAAATATGTTNTSATVPVRTAGIYSMFSHRPHIPILYLTNESEMYVVEPSLFTLFVLLQPDHALSLYMCFLVIRNCAPI